MKKNLIFSLIALCFLVSGTLTAQEGRILNAHSKTLEWAYLGRIANGKNPPTTIQTISVREGGIFTDSIRGSLRRTRQR